MERSDGSALVKIILSLWPGIALGLWLSIFAAGAGKLVDWMVWQSLAIEKEWEQLDIEEEFAQQAEEIRQWIVREKGLPDEELDVQCEGLSASFSYRDEIFVMAGYPVEDGIKETGYLQEDGTGENPSGKALEGIAPDPDINGEKAAGRNEGDIAVNPLLEPNGLWNYGRLWEYCGDILDAGDAGAWRHDTYPLLANPGEQAVVLLYQTSEGEAGCLYLTDTLALRLAMGKDEKEAGRLDEAKMYLEAAANMQKFADVIKTPEKVAAGWDSLWAGAFQELCAGKAPYEDIGWADEKIREEIVWEIKGMDRYALVSREEVMGLETLHISNAEDVECFGDFRYMQDLHTLSVSYWEPEQTDVSKLLEQLPALPGLTGLEIRNTSLSDLSFVEDVAGLKELVLDGRGIQDISPLRACTGLRKLQLMGGKVCDVTPLSGLKELEYLVLYDNEVESLEGLETLENLAFLDISHNKAEDLSPLAGMGRLEELYAGDNCIVDIAPLEGLEKLRCLSLGKNRIEDISALAGLKELVYLWAEDNRIGDCGPLEGLEKLYFLSVSHDSGQDVGNLARIPYLALVSPTLEAEALDGLAGAGGEEGTEREGQLELGEGLRGEEDPGIKGNSWFEEVLGTEEEPMLEEKPELKEIAGQGEGSSMETAAEAGEEPGMELKLAQRWLDMLYPDWETEAKDIVKGDMNGDGINDMAIIGILPEDKKEDGYAVSGAWYIFPVMSNGGLNNGMKLTEPVLISGPGQEDADFSYLGAALSNGQLMVQYGEYSSHSLIRKTDIYGYDGKQMVKKWEQALQFGSSSEDSVWRLEDMETGITQLYAISDGEGRERRLLSEEEIE